MNFTHDILPLRDRLFRLSLRITLNREEAEDVVQDVMLRLWQKRDELTDVANLETYAMTMARNLALDRKALSVNRSVSLSEELHDSPTIADSPDVRLIHSETANRLSAAIDSLPEKQRSVLQLRDIEGRSYAEIATVLSLSESDVKVTLFRARNKLKEQLQSMNINKH